MPHRDATNERENLLNLAFKSEFYSQNYPHIFQTPQSEYFFENFDSEQILAGFCTAYNISWSHSKFGLVRAICIGNVCSYPQRKGQGWAQKAIVQALECAKNSHFDFAFLFSDMLGFYEKFGFEKAAAEKYVVFSLNSTGNLSVFNSNFLKSKMLDLNSKGFAKSRKFMRGSSISLQNSFHSQELFSLNNIWNFLEKNSAATDGIVGFIEFQVLMRIPKMEFFATYKENEICAFSFYGKGEDLQNFVHGLVARDSNECLWHLGNIHQNLMRHEFMWLPGSWAQKFKSEFKYEENSSLYVLNLNAKFNTMTWLNSFNRQEIYVRSLHSS